MGLDGTLQKIMREGYLVTSHNIKKKHKLNNT